MKNRDIENYWQKTAPAFSNQYKLLFGLPVSPTGFFLYWRHQKIAKILGTLPGKQMLDVGCGSGVFMMTGLRLGKTVTGIDYSQQMLASARKNLAAFPATKYELRQATAQKMSVADNTMDIIIASGLTDYLGMNATRRFMLEVSRVLKKEGVAIITFPKKRSPLAFLRTGWGLALRKLFLHLPPIQTVYTKFDIISLCQQAALVPYQWDDVMSTMYLVLVKKK